MDLVGLGLPVGGEDYHGFGLDLLGDLLADGLEDGVDGVGSVVLDVRLGRTGVSRVRDVVGKGDLPLRGSRSRLVLSASWEMAVLVSSFVSWTERSTQKTNSS